MATLLIIRKYSEASRATSFAELWRSLNNDQLFHLCKMLRLGTGRDLDPPFNRATPEDWTAMRTLITILGSAATRLNAILSGADWTNNAEIDGVLEQTEREAVRESGEYLAVMRYLIEEVRLYCAFGRAGSDDYGLLEFRNLPIPPVLDESSYDMFVCYKTSRHATQAARLVEQLTDLGYRVWFDKIVLNRVQNRPEVFEKGHLVSILTNAVQHSRCTIVFEAMMHAVQLSPNQTEEETLASRTTMKSANNALVAWDWQILEIGATKRGIAIHPTTVTAFRTEDGQTIWARTFYYVDDEQLLASIKSALVLFDETDGIDSGRQQA